MKKLLGLAAVMAFLLGLLIVACGEEDDDGEECKKECAGKLCGDDGCGGTCGKCGAGLTCNEKSGACLSAECTTKCANAECGAVEGCNCGVCPAGKSCENSKCVALSADCKAKCAGKECGTAEGCNCGDCPAGKKCDVNFACVDDTGPCLPDCEAKGKECGDDGCGDSCGSCPPGVICDPVTFKCVCTPDCAGKECGPDACGGFCGAGPNEGCAEGKQCSLLTGKCEPIPVADCAGKQCGPDGAGGSCGACPCDGCAADAVDCVDGKCQAPEAPDCGMIYDCFDTCQPQDRACGQNCVNVAPLEVQMAFNAWQTCLTQVDINACYDSCPPDCETLDCCPSEARICVYEGIITCMDSYWDCFPGGEGSCGDLYVCLSGCPAGDAGDMCAEACFGDVGKEGYTKWMKFVVCLGKNGSWDCAEGDEACLQAAWDQCQPELQDCAHGDLSCKEIWDCLDTCAPTDQLCGLACLVSGTVEAQDQYDGIVDCLIEQCGEETTQECQDQALKGACSEKYNDCLGAM